MDRQDLGKITLALSAEHLDIPGLQALGSALDQINEGKPDTEAPLSTEEQAQLRALAAPVLAASPRVAIDSLHWETPEGSSEFKAQAEFRPAAEGAPEDLGGYLESAIRQVSAQLSLSKRMLLQVARQTQSADSADMAVALLSMVFDQYAGRLERQGLVQRQGDTVSADYRYADGQITANGQAMAPADFAAQFGLLLGLGG